MAMNDTLDALDELNDSMQTAYCQCRTRALEAAPERSELERRKAALNSIREILQWRPLESFKAEHLEFLETLIAYWRELEVEAGAPEPDGLQ